MTTDAFLADCRSRLAFGLRERIGGISSEVLTEALRRLQFTLLAPNGAMGASASAHGDAVPAAREAAEHG